MVNKVRIVSAGDNKDDITDDYDQKYGWATSRSNKNTLWKTVLDLS